MKKYSMNRYDCVGFILEELGIKVKRELLPETWWNKDNRLIETLIKYILEGKINKKIEKFILNPTQLLPGDIMFMRLRGKFIHHMGIMSEDGHFFHNTPARGVTKDYLRKGSGIFKFAIRLRS